MIFKTLKKAITNPYKTINPTEYIIVGLGNPGQKYENTRHNAGFLTIDHIVNDLHLTNSKLKYQSQIFDATIAGHRVLLVKPQTYMNLSGDAVRKIMDFYKIDIEKLIVIVDDISLFPGKLRIRKKGSSGGHNGIKDIINKTGYDNFPRIKIGVGAKPERWNLADWVTSEFSDADRKQLNTAIENAYGALKLMLDGKTDEAMNKFNS